MANRSLRREKKLPTLILNATPERRLGSFFRMLLGGGWGVGRFNRMNHRPLVSELYDPNGNPIFMRRELSTLILNVTPERRPESSDSDVTRE